MTDIKEIMNLAIEIWNTTYWTSPQKERFERFYLAAYAAGAAHERKECAELCKAEANGRSPLAFDALHECADLIMEGYEK